MVSKSLITNSSKDENIQRTKVKAKHKFISINIKNLSFCYNDDQFVLRNISLDFNRGEITGIIGRSDRENLH